MAKRLVLLFLAASSLAILGASLVGGAAAEVAFAFFAMALPPALMLLGVVKRGRFGPAVWPIAALAVLLLASLAGMLAFRGEVVGAPRLLGLPPGAAIQVLGLFLVPLLVVTLGFACTFDRFAPTREELEKLRSLARARREP